VSSEVVTRGCRLNITSATKFRDHLPMWPSNVARMTAFRKAYRHVELPQLAAKCLSRAGVFEPRRHLRAPHEPDNLPSARLRLSPVRRWI
jgi:hypothetical protein